MMAHDRQLSVEEAYRAMFLFLEGYYERTGSDEIGGLLGGFSFLGDGQTADPAAWDDWTAAVEALKTTPTDHYELKLKPPDDER